MRTPPPTNLNAKRRNLRLLVMGLVGMLILAGGLSLLSRKMRERRQRQTVEWAERALKEKRYDEAAAQFARAVAQRPNDAQLNLEAGDALYALSASKPQALEQARVSWQTATQIDPCNCAAWRRLLQLQLDTVEIRPTADTYKELGRVARSLGQACGSDSDAAAAQLIAELGDWLAQPGPASPADATRHQKNLDSLAGAVRRDPPLDLAVAPYALAVARRAVELREQGDRRGAEHLVDSATQALSARRDGNSDSLYRMAQGLTIVAQAHRRIDELSSVNPARAPLPPTTQLTQTRGPIWPRWDPLTSQLIWQSIDPLPPAHAAPLSKDAQQCFEQARTVAGRAVSAMQPTDRHYVDAQLLSAHLAVFLGDPRAAEQICRQTCSARPGNLRAALALAGLLATSHPDEALAILDKSENADDDGPGPVSLTRRRIVAAASELKARLYLDTASANQDPTARAAYLQKASAACDALAAMLVEDSESRRLTSRLRLLQGKYLDVVRLSDTGQAQGSNENLDLLSDRATALCALHRSNAAVETLHRILAADPSRISERVLLARTLTDLGRITEADKQIDWLEEQSGQDSRVLELRVRWLAACSLTDPDSALATRLEAAYSKLPEQSMEQKLAKAEVALDASRPADAVRLLRSAHAAEPSSIRAIAALVRANIANNELNRASHLLTDSISQYPGAADLVNLQNSFRPNSFESHLASISGPNAKEFLDAARASREAIESGDLPRAQERIDAMARLRPDELLHDELQLQYDLAARDWNDAATCQDRLARANFDGAQGLSYAFELEMARHEPYAATEVARKMTGRYPGSSAGWLDLGTALSADGRNDLAIDCLLRANHLNPSDVEPLKALAACCESAGRSPEADQWIATGLHVAPTDPDLRRMQVEHQLQSGDPHRLIAGCEAAVQHGPEIRANWIALGRVYLRISTLENLSKPQEAHDALAKALTTLNEAVKKWPDDKDCAFWAAHATAIGGDVAGGKQILLRLCDQPAWSRRPQASQALADFCLTWGDLNTAEQALGDAIKRGGDPITLSRRLSAVLMRRGTLPAAIDVLRSQPGDGWSQQERIGIAVAAGQAPAEEKELQTELHADPLNGRLMSLLGILHALQHDHDQAKLWLDRAIAAGDDQLAAQSRGAMELHARPANLPAATDDLTIAHQAEPSDPASAILLSDAWLAHHDPERAARPLAVALALSPWEKELRSSLISLEEHAPQPNWDRIFALIDAGHSASPSDWTWDAAEARMWSTRHRPQEAAALIHQAIQLAESKCQFADPAMQTQCNQQVRALVPDELWMLLQSGDNDATLAEADRLLSHYGSQDILSAWAHHAKAAVQRRAGSDDGGSAEYFAALQTARRAGGFQAASDIVEAISSDAGADEAVRRIDAYRASLGQSPGTGDHQPDEARWDLLRIDLLRRNGEFQAASQDLDKLMPALSALPADLQNTLCRMAVAVYLQDSSPEQHEKARAACEALLRLAPADPWALNNMALLNLDYSNRPDPTKALDYSQRAMESAAKLGPIDPRIIDTYGWTLLNAGQAKKAVAALEPITSPLPIPDVQYHLAEAYLSAGNPAAAWPHLLSAARMILQSDKNRTPVDPRLRTAVVNAAMHAMGAFAYHLWGEQEMP